MEWLVFTIFEQFMLNLGNGWLYQMISSRDYAEMQLTVGPVRPRPRANDCLTGIFFYLQLCYACEIDFIYFWQDLPPFK
jgi:hypothetical protein